MDDDLKSKTDGGIAGAVNDAIAGATDKSAPPVTVHNLKRQIGESTVSLTQQAGDKAMMFADQGKGRAVDALEQLSKLIEDAAAQVDEKIGGGNGQYVRTAASTVQGFADQLRDKSVDDLVADARALIRKSPGAAIGAAAAVGFVVTRLVSAGIDQRDA